MLQDILKNLNVPETASRIYLRLLETGISSARQLAENLNLPRPSVYDNLKILINLGLVTEIDQENKKLFRVDDVKNISHLVQERISDLQKQKSKLKEVIPKLKAQADFLEPKIKFYSGQEGVRRAINDILWYENINTLCIWPISEMIDMLGTEWLAEHNRKRIRKKIYLQTIWPQDKAVKFKQYPFLGVTSGFLRKIRLAPEGMTWNMGYWLYADKVAFISSRKESFGFTVHSRDFAELIKSQFELVWPLCKKIKVNSKDTDAFLKTV
ncbi:ArsR family transcriptional regulator [Candidatus Parcubacteria bacterium]|nr:MAG: ArsR family transcriptional regulator [Candidatus Parcubacteria bacterium]